MYKLIQHKLGFFQVDPMPDEKELQAYYSNKYFQSPTVATYSRSYSDEELNLTKIACEVADNVFRRNSTNTSHTLYDVGCGAGYFMDGLQKLGWHVWGTDYSEEGVRNHNPHLADSVSYLAAIDDIILKNKSGSRFSLVNLGNILEHVIDPIAFINHAKKLLDAKGLLRIVVPNDHSDFQLMLKGLGLSNDEWFYPPDHLSYFNFDSLKAFLNYVELDPIKAFGDFPIEIFLLNRHSNYYLNKENGREAHFARIKTVNFIRQKGLDTYMKWAESLAISNLSRSCIVFCKPPDIGEQNSQ